MSRDAHRGRGQWRGCYSFEDIVCDDGATVSAIRRNGGLKMGATYYYYYELDGSTETYDPTEPSTTACPYLPGQTVNMLSVPVERSSRQRRASLNNLQDESFKTMNPDAKFITPHPSPASAASATTRRLGSASTLLLNPLSNSPPPPTPSWRRFFTRRPQSQNRDYASTSGQTMGYSILDSQRAPTPYPIGPRPRELSPENLRKFLSDDTSAPPDLNHGHLPQTLFISEDVTEETEDDDNFATSATSEQQLYTTYLSPPPFQRSASSDTVARIAANVSPFTFYADKPPDRQQSPRKERASRPKVASALPKLDISAPIRWSISVTGSKNMTSPNSQSVEDEPPCFDESNDEDEFWSGNDSDNFAQAPLPSGRSFKRQAFKGYSLPCQVDETKGVVDSSAAATSFRAPRLLAGCDSAAPLSGANLLDAPIETGLDDFANELSWIVDVIDSK